MRDHHRALRASLAAGAALAALLLVGQAPAHAGVPSAGNSSVPARIVVCPAGDSMLIVVARHLSNNPWFEGPIWADVCNCPGFRLSTVAPICRAPDTSACHVAMTPDPTGTVEIPVSGGGLCPGGSVRVFAGGVLLAVLPEPACFDQDGDLRVDSTDVAIVRSKLGTNDPGADFDGDGVVTEQDVAILLQHVGHASPDATLPARPKPGGAEVHEAVTR